MKALFPVVLAAVLALPVAAAAQGAVTAETAPFPIAYLSPQRAFALSVDGKAAQARLTALETERARDIEARNKALQTQRPALRPDQVQKFEVDLQRFIQDAQAEITGVQRELESAFLAKLRPALDAIVKEKGLRLVLNEDAGFLVWADPALDLTPEVARRIDMR